GPDLLPDPAAARMAAGAGLERRVEIRRRCGAPHRGMHALEPPRRRVASREPDLESGVGATRTVFRRGFSPLDVPRTGTVARFAGDVDLLPGGRVAIGRRVVAALHVGGVAFGAHVVPVLIGGG